MTISIEALEEAIKIKKQIAELEAKLQKILAGAPEPKAKRGRKSAPTPVTAVDEESHEVITKPAKKRKRKLTPEARERISEAQKARWAARRKA